jgi:hypothetical protein
MCAAMNGRFFESHQLYQQVLLNYGSNSAEAVGFFRAKKFPARLPSEGK